MDEQTLQTALAGLPLGAVRYCDRVGSTNDEAARWVESGAPDMALVVADEQTQGRGRDGRTWVTPAGAALAFSLVLYPHETAAHVQSRLTALGALAVRQALHQQYHLPAQIKWPNDVLINRRKVAGVLAEAHWSGGELKALILGIGINVAHQAVVAAERQAGSLYFPAGCLDEFNPQPVARGELLHYVLQELLYWRPRLAAPEFLQTWEASLALRGEPVQIAIGHSLGKDGLPRSLENQPPMLEEGYILGLSPDGSLRLRKANGEIINVHFGEVRLRPVQIP